MYAYSRHGFYDATEITSLRLMLNGGRRYVSVIGVRVSKMRVSGHKNLRN